MAIANEQAQQFSHGFIDTEHILLGLLKEGSGAAILNGLGVNIEELLAEVEQLPKGKAGTTKTEKLPQSEGAVNVIKYAIEEARTFEHNYIGTEHILLGLFLETDGIAAQVLTNLGVKIEDVRDEIARRSRLRQGYGG